MLGFRARTVWVSISNCVTVIFSVTGTVVTIVTNKVDEQVTIVEVSVVTTCRGLISGIAVLRISLNFSNIVIVVIDVDIIVSFIVSTVFVNTDVAVSVQNPLNCVTVAAVVMVNVPFWNAVPWAVTGYTCGRCVIQ